MFASDSSDGVQDKDQIGLFSRSIFVISSPDDDLMLTWPLKSPKAKTWPSDDQSEQIIFEWI